MTVSRLLSAIRQLLLAVAGVIVRPVGGRDASIAGRVDRRGAPSAGSTCRKRKVERAYGRFLALACVLTAVLASGSAVAVAALTEPLIGSFDGSGSTAGAFQGVDDIAVSQTTGRAFVPDQGHQVVGQFGASGTAQPFTGLSGTTGISVPGALDHFSRVAIDSSGTASDGNIYVTSFAQRELLGFSSAGVPLAGFPISLPTPTAVAVDSTGHVWAYDLNAGLKEYTSAGTPVSGPTLGGGDDILGMAFDSTGDLYALQFGHVNKYDPSGGSFVQDPTTPVFDSSGQAEALAVDPVSGHVYVAHPGFIEDYDAAATLVDQFGSGMLSSAVGVAVNGTSGHVYVADDSGNGMVDIFGVLGTYPDVSTATATNVTPTSATLNGTVNPDSTTLTDCHFDYGTTTAYGQQAACVPAPGTIPSDSATHAVSADVAGLTPGAIYHFRLVAANSTGTIVTGDQLFGPPLVLSETVGNASIGPAGATLQAVLNPQNLDTTYHFDYGTTTGYGQSTPQSGSIGSDLSDHAVSLGITGLQPATTYHCRVVASNAAGTTDGPDLTFTTLPPVLIDIQPPTGMSTPSGLSTGTATLNVYLDPQGQDTGYHFEYGTTTGYGSSTPTADAGSASSPQPESAQVTGLQPDTTYHYRTVASNTFGTATGPDSVFTTPPSSCPNTQFRTGLSAQLPDCRAYEQVSPLGKAGYGADLPVIAPAGDRVMFFSGGVFAGEPTGGINPNAYLARRTSGGWSTVGINAPTTLGFIGGGSAGIGFSAAVPDLSEFSTDALVSTENQLDERIFLRESDGSFAPASPVIHPTPTNSEAELVCGASADLSHLAICGSRPLLSSDSDTSPDQRVYEVAGAGGSSPVLRLVNLDSSGTPFSPCFTGATSLGSGLTFHKEHAVSQDGTKIFFSTWAAGLSGGCGGSAAADTELLARVGGQTTLDLSDPQANDECTTSACQSAPPAGADYQDASVDGSKVFFLSTRQLTDAASEDPDSNDGGPGCGRGPLQQGPNGCNLYMYDFNRPAGHNLVALSAGDSSGLGPEVRAVVRVSDDGSRVYFVASGVLTGQPNTLGQGAHAGADNLYVYDTTSGTVAFIAELCSGSGQSGSVTAVTQCSGPGDDTDSSSFSQDSVAGRSDATPDGRFLVFTSYAQLTPDDQNQAADVYEYDAQTGGLWRVSVGHDGQDQNGNGGGQDALVHSDAVRAATFTGPSNYGAQRHVVTDDGRTVVFQTSRPLESTATNGLVDAYEWHDGQVALISGGQAGDPNNTVAVSPSGADIVFDSTQGLVPQDVDSLYDAYDARVDGGFPSPAPPAQPCSGDACQGAPSGGPPSPAAGSVSFSGPGNATPSGGTPASRAMVLTRTVRGSAVLMAVRVPGPGRISIVGAGIRTARMTALRAGTYRLRVTLTPRMRTTLRRRHRLRLMLHVSFAPAGGVPSSAAVVMTVKH